jgi:hypothetical protein
MPKGETTMKTHRNESRRSDSNVARKPAKKIRAVREKTSGKHSTLRDGTKSAKVIRLLRRAAGATIKDLIAATRWQPHSVRGFLSGVIRKKLGLNLITMERKNGERAYKITAR